jgi:hypothetical protein
MSLGAYAQWSGFAPFVSYNAGDDVRLFHTTDLTGDAVPDLTVLYTAAHTSFALMAGRGDGSFGAVQTKAKDENYFLSDIADLNRDGHPDMVISSYWANGFKVYYGEGGGRLREGPYFMTGTHGRAVKCVDINKDGLVDIVGVTSGSGQPIYLHVFEGKGDGTFATKKTFPSVLDTSKDIIITDKNRDGLPDVVVTSSFPWVVLFKQKADGSFEPVYYPTGTPARVAFADVNRDGGEDMVLLYSSFDNTPGSDSLVVRLNSGGDDFSASQKVEGLGARSLRPSSLLVHDLDRDGFKDLLFNHHDIDGNPTDTLFYLAGQAGARFSAPVFLLAPAKVLYTAVADLNGDNWPDLVVSCEGATVNIALNRGGKAEEEPAGLLVYPNPARGWLMVHSGVTGTHTIHIYSAAGQLVREARVQEARSRVEVPQLSGGLYFVEVTAGNSKQVQSVVIQN